MGVEMNFDFGDVLSRAWQIIWKHKVLWIFGILAGCSSGSSGFRGSSGGGGGDNGGTGQLPPEAMRILQIIQQNLITFIVVGCIVVLLIWAITIVLGTIGRVGLIRGTFQAEGGAERLIFDCCNPGADCAGGIDCRAGSLRDFCQPWERFCQNWPFWNCAAFPWLYLSAHSGAVRRWHGRPPGGKRHC